MPGVDFLQAGCYAPSAGPFSALTTPGLTASRSHFARFVAPKAMTITKMAFNVGNAASTDDPCDVGIYSAAGVLLSASGSKSGLLTTTGIKIVTLSAPVNLVAGAVYYAGFAYGPVGGTAVGLTCTTIANAGGWTMLGAGLGNIEQTFNNTTFPLPATMAVSGPISSVPVMALVQ